ncbi:recombinase family protein [Bacillus sp. Marseille-P3661]|uniref:recombinase family protein n=1 Tax=Bacillus sp. Marseille-P3661 TaxID=1936234 RepID=UPI000C862E69|nr:recombinase family protein [Bacillus sp. Marseille-P3661]
MRKEIFMKEQQLIVVYKRVSSAAQSLELQDAAARRYLESHDLAGNEDFIIYLSDYDVSATKLKMSQRPKLMELIRLIQEGKVKTVIGYKRDRFARNFYEFVDITKIFIKHGVEVIYTASNEPPFRNKLALEAFYGMFGQIEGENIRSRTDDARKQFPSSIFGFKRIKEEGKVRFLIDENRRDMVVTLFNDFSNVSDEEQFIEFLLIRRKGLTKPEKLLRLLTNPFYSAHYESKNGYQLLPHVEPMISLDLFLAVKTQFDKFISYYQEKLQKVNTIYSTTPLCGECNSVMKHRNENPLDTGYFVCSDNHRRVAISAEEFNDLLIQTILDHVQSISIYQAEKIIIKRIIAENKRLEREQKKAVSEYLDASLTVSTLDKKNKPLIPKYLDKIKELKERHNSIGQDLLALKELSDDIKNVKQLIQLNYNISQQELQKLIELLVDKALVFETHVQIVLYLSAFRKDVDVS